MIYFLRHQKTANNQYGIISGQADSPIITKDIWTGNVNMDSLDTVYSSPSRRCIETLHLIPGLKLPPTIDERLLERRMGDFENRSRKELYEEFPTYFRNIGGRVCFQFELTPPNGETYTEFAERISSFCEEIMSATEEKNILICSHNQAMKMMHFILKGIQPTEEAWYKISFPNGEIVSLI